MYGTTHGITVGDTLVRLSGLALLTASIPLAEEHGRTTWLPSVLNRVVQREGIAWGAPPVADSSLHKRGTLDNTFVLNHAIEHFGEPAGRRCMQDIDWEKGSREWNGRRDGSSPPPTSLPLSQLLLCLLKSAAETHIVFHAPHKRLPIDGALKL